MGENGDEKAGNWLDYFQTNFSILELEDLYHPKLNAVYSIYCDVILAISICGFIFAIYTVLKKSPKEMKNYKYYLIHQLVWSLLFDVHMGGWKPVPLWPFYLGYSVGWYSFLHGKWAMYPFMGIMFFSIGMGFSLYITVLHRYMQASPFSKFYKLYTYTAIRAFIYVIIFLCLEMAFLVPGTIANVNQDFENVKFVVIGQADFMAFFFQNFPNMFGFSTSTESGLDILMMPCILLALVLIILSLFGLYFNFKRILRKNKALLSAATFNMQIMLFQTLVIQMMVAIIFLIFPITSSLILSLFHIRWVSTYSVIMMMITVTHAILDIIVTIYYIRPYREFASECVNKVTRIVFGFELIKKQTFVVVPASTTVNI